MKIPFDNKKTDWVTLPANVTEITAHFKDGHCVTYSFVEFVTLGNRIKNNIVAIEYETI